MAADLLENAQDVIERDPANADLFLHEGVRAMLDYAFLAVNRPLPRTKQFLSALAALNPDLAALARQYYGAADTAARMALATQIATRTIGETGFFEWESPTEEIPA